MKRGTNSANFVKLAQGIRPQLGVYILKFGKISVKFSVLGSYTLYCCSDRSEIWRGVDSSAPNAHCYRTKTIWIFSCSN